MKTIVISLMKGLFLKCVDRRATRMGFVIEIRSDPRLISRCRWYLDNTRYDTHTPNTLASGSAGITSRTINYRVFTHRILVW